MNRSQPIVAFGIFFLLIAGGLFALTLRQPAPAPANPTKSQLREQAALAAEKKKMRLAAACLAAVGGGLIAFS